MERTFEFPPNRIRRACFCLNTLFPRAKALAGPLPLRSQLSPPFALTGTPNKPSLFSSSAFLSVVPFAPFPSHLPLSIPYSYCHSSLVWNPQTEGSYRRRLRFNWLEQRPSSSGAPRGGIWKSVSCIVTIIPVLTRRIEFCG
ncbi:unnamed protein product [Prunus armeniaca]|uniref:Uncharacterized protein n=1 Tax=Prunus armeniaca TaxID=36596 RepID=A0A6J5TQ00_PRUAR|nr:unnamed protein product [Prunus armeniaca]